MILTGLDGKLSACAEGPARSATAKTDSIEIVNVGQSGLMTALPSMANQPAKRAGENLQGTTPAYTHEIDLVINLKTAKALGITVPLPLQMTANDVVE